MLVHPRSLPRNLLGCPNNLPVPIYTPEWREAVSPARARTRTACTGVERANHEATAPPTQKGIDIECMCEVQSQSVRANNNFSEECELGLMSLYASVKQVCNCKVKCVTCDD